jgi:hypothetical protein
MEFLEQADPYAVLGVARDASEAEVRARYLELVKQYPPEQNPDAFRAVRAAFEAAKDPLIIARQLTQPPGLDVPKWSDAIEAQRRIPPRLTSSFILSLGNRPVDAAAGSVDMPPQDSDSDTPPTAPRD